MVPSTQYQDSATENTLDLTAGDEEEDEVDGEEDEDA